MPKVESIRTLPAEATEPIKAREVSPLPLLATLKPLILDQTPLRVADRFENKPELLEHIKLTMPVLMPLAQNPTLMAEHSDPKRYIRAAVEAPLFALAGPSPNDVRQGLMGSCYLLSALSALAETNPQAIRDLIQKNTDGSYTVRFYRAVEGLPGPNSVPVSIRVSNEIPLRVDRNEKGDPYAYTTLYATSVPRDVFSDKPEAMPETAMWVAMVEKAYAVFKGGSYGAMYSGWSHDAFASILGRPAARLSLNQLGEKASFDILREATESKTPVTISTWTDKEHVAMYTNSGLLAAHAYTFLGVSERNGQRYVTLRNPWGRVEPVNRGPDDGRFELEFETAMKYFDLFCLSPKEGPFSKKVFALSAPDKPLEVQPPPLPTPVMPFLRTFGRREDS